MSMYRVELKYATITVKTLEDADYVFDQFIDEVERVLMIDDVLDEDGTLVRGKPVVKDLTLPWEKN